MKISEARDVCLEWQKSLGLESWDVRVRWANPKDKMTLDDYGQIMWWTEECRAEMILHRKNADVETIVHELMHVRLEGHRPEPLPYDAVYEQGLNRVVSILVNGVSTLGQ